MVLSEKQFAKHFNITPQRVKRLRKAGHIFPIRVQGEGVAARIFYETEQYKDRFITDTREVTRFLK